MPRAKSLSAKPAVKHRNVPAGSLLFSLAVLFSTASTAQGSTDAVNVDVGECVKLESPADRYACYERHVDSALKKNGESSAEDSGNGASGEREEDGTKRSERRANRSAGRGGTAAAAQAEADHASETGRKAAEADAEDSRKARGERRREQGANSEITGTIAALRETVPHQYVISLTNGQVWRQTRPEQYLLQVGQQVHLRPTKWGKSYRLSVEELRGFIQVERVR